MITENCHPSEPFFFQVPHIYFQENHYLQYIVSTSLMASMNWNYVYYVTMELLIKIAKLKFIPIH